MINNSLMYFTVKTSIYLITRPSEWSKTCRHLLEADFVCDGVAQHGELFCPKCDSPLADFVPITTHVFRHNSVSWAHRAGVSVAQNMRLHDHQTVSASTPGRKITLLYSCRNSFLCIRLQHLSVRSTKVRRTIESSYYLLRDQVGPLLSISIMMMRFLHQNSFFSSFYTRSYSPCLSEAAFLAADDPGSLWAHYDVPYNCIHITVSI